eukprot:TRINITY_DN5361_c0_g1_i1.p1 TRINITY_DN5361_c0_g1~~TRINITY_DN5361_c0_g1_i1.p1  ORF type:complete len:590 (-),score=185.23 TRINITY_DN5361_c0_g1_i1:97-1866(-)
MGFDDVHAAASPEEQPPLQALGPYQAGFNASCPEAVFLHYHSINALDKTLIETTYTRQQFWDLSLRAASVLRAHGAGKGHHVLHYFSKNTVEDLAFRLAGAILGSVPVTVNWQADEQERVLYKARLTEAVVCVTDSGVKGAHLEALAAEGVAVFDVQGLDKADLLPSEHIDPSVAAEDTKMVIFTSGTTGDPKGVQSTFSAYDTNKQTFENFLHLEDPSTAAVFVLVNPLHHTNSSAISDWAIRRPNCVLHLSERYSTAHWGMLERITSGAHESTRVICPMVAKHFDFLEALIEGHKLEEIGAARLEACLHKAEPLIGSAPVGRTTVQRLMKYAKKLPHVRFGSTETCLQVTGTPVRGYEEQLQAFEDGWNHTWQGGKQVGYFIGRAHPPYTEVKVVHSVTKGEDRYMQDVELGEPGILVCRGGNVMKGYVKNEAATLEALHDGWYTNFGDVCFFLEDPSDQQLNLYWQSRTSAMLIIGGSNYAYEQVQGEISSFIHQTCSLDPSTDYEVAVVGVNLKSEHEDECYLTVECKSEAAVAMQAELQATLLAGNGLPKWAKSGYVRFAEINKNFKGAILYKELKLACLEEQK